MRRVLPIALTLALVLGAGVFFLRGGTEPERAPTAPPGSLAAKAPYALPTELQEPARRFFTSWTRYLYGQVDADSIQSVDPTVRSGIAAIGPRQTTIYRKRTVRVDTLRGSTPGGARIEVHAVIDDGQLRYPRLATFERIDGAWIVREIADPE